MVAQEKLLRFLDKIGLDYFHQTKKAINICCPFCSDDGYHCGVFYDNLKFSCWKCGSKGTLYEIVSNLYNLSFKEYQSLLLNEDKDYDLSAVKAIQDNIGKETAVQTKSSKTIIWPPKETASIKKLQGDPLVNSFIKKRKLTMPFCIQQDIYIGLGGLLNNYFVIPVIENRTVVAYQGRSMVDNGSHKYHSNGIMGNFLFNYDNIIKKSSVVITEGIFSCWACQNSVATFGSSMSDAQVYKLYTLHPTEIIIAWDMGEDGSDAFWKGKKLQEVLRSFFSNIPVQYLLLPPGKDPDDIGKKDMIKLIDSQRTYQEK